MGHISNRPSLSGLTYCHTASSGIQSIYNYLHGKPIRPKVGENRQAKQNPSFFAACGNLSQPSVRPFVPAQSPWISTCRPSRSVGWSRLRRLANISGVEEFGIRAGLAPGTNGFSETLRRQNGARPW